MNLPSGAHPLVHDLLRRHRPAIALGGDGSEFAALFEVGTLVELSDLVWFTLRLRLLNYSEVGLRDAVIRLPASLSGSESGSVAIVSLDPGQSVRLSGGFLLTPREFQNWLGSPSLEIEFQRRGGQPVRRTIRLLREPVVLQ